MILSGHSVSQCTSRAPRVQESVSSGNKNCSVEHLRLFTRSILIWDMTSLDRLCVVERAGTKNGSNLLKWENLRTERVISVEEGWNSCGGDRP